MQIVPKFVEHSLSPDPTQRIEPKDAYIDWLMRMDRNRFQGPPQLGNRQRRGTWLGQEL